MYPFIYICRVIRVIIITNIKYIHKKLFSFVFCKYALAYPLKATSFSAYTQHSTEHRRNRLCRARTIYLVYSPVVCPIDPRRIHNTTYRVCTPIPQDKKHWKSTSLFFVYFINFIPSNIQFLPLIAEDNIFYVHFMVLELFFTFYFLNSKRATVISNIATSGVPINCQGICICDYRAENIGKFMMKF